MTGRVAANKFKSQGQGLLLLKGLKGLCVFLIQIPTPNDDAIASLTKATSQRNLVKSTDRPGTVSNLCRHVRSRTIVAARKFQVSRHYWRNRLQRASCSYRYTYVRRKTRTVGKDKTNKFQTTFIMFERYLEFAVRGAASISMYRPKLSGRS